MKNALVVFLFALVAGFFPRAQASVENSVEKSADERTRIRISKATLEKYSRPSSILKAVSLKTVEGLDDEMTCVRITEIRDKSFQDLYKARVGDCISEVRIFHPDRQGFSSDIYPITSPIDAVVVFKGLHGAARVDIDFQRKNKLVPVTYVADAD